MVSLRKPGKFSLHKNTHLFPDLFNNTALPPTFSGALLIVNISACWLFFSLYSQFVYSQYNLRKKFTKRILLIQRSHSNCSLLLIFVLTRARACGGCRARACVAAQKRKLACAWYRQHSLSSAHRCDLTSSSLVVDQKC